MADVADSAPAKPKEKTKAKQRYLKKKKERRKSNKKSTAPPPINPSVGLEEQSEAEDHDDEEEEVVKEALKPQESKPDRRPKKRRKVEEPVEAADEDHDEPLLEDSFHSKSRKSPTLEGALPIFPPPALPNAPSKSDLALQGLDKALVDAEFVDSSTTLPIGADDADDNTALSSKIKKRLNELGIVELFAVQKHLVPFLLPKDPQKRLLYLPYDPPRDVCVSAPTGSGKTLAYVVPIIEILSARIVTRLRALVVLPTRDLVMQVRETFEVVGKGRGLKVCTATGQHSFAQEQSQLVTDKTTDLQGGSSKADILICTPGRLIDHLNETPNFSLQHLRFLVIDEADRLLAQSFQGWLVRVLAATRPPPNASAISSPSVFHPDALAPAFIRTPFIHPASYVPEQKESSCQKLLFSATLTRDPDKIASLSLRDPKYFIVQQSKGQLMDVAMEKFSMPDTLSEHMVVCASAQKPLIFLHLVYNLGVTNALVFTKSTESTTRLVQLFDFFEQTRKSGIKAQAYSSDLGVGERKGILERFKGKEIQILVCSDLVSRGIDISHVSHVVSYDAPVDMRKYVHRVGRTARAGRDGSAWTLVEEQEARYFKGMLKDAGHLEKLKRVRVGDKDLEGLTENYGNALEHLKNVYVR